MRIVLDNRTDLTVELPSELLDFSNDQLQALKDISLIIDNAGLKIYGQIGIN